MAAESGTAPAEEDHAGEGWEATPPPGWMWIEDDHLAPDPRHPDHPINREKRQPGVWRRLDADPEIQAFVGRLRPTVTEASRAFHRVAPYAARDPRILRSENPFLASVFDSLERASEELGPPDVLPHSKIRYLIEKTFPAEFVPDVLGVCKSASVWLFISTQGYFCMTFVGASADERRAYNKLIENAQRHFKLRGNKGGRPRRVDQSTLADPRFVARLRLAQGRDHKDIKRILAALYPTDSWSSNTLENVTERIDRYVRDGDAALRVEVGPDWARLEAAPSTTTP